jgi:rubredoxin
MVKDDPTNFICPGCQARYKLVRAKAETRFRDVPLHCRVCKQPLAAMDGENILKYFLISRPKTRQSQAQPRLVTTATPPDV